MSVINSELIFVLGVRNVWWFINFNFNFFAPSTIGCNALAAGLPGGHLPAMKAGHTFPTVCTEQDTGLSPLVGSQPVL